MLLPGSGADPAAAEMIGPSPGLRAALLATCLTAAGCTATSGTSSAGSPSTAAVATASTGGGVPEEPPYVPLTPPPSEPGRPPLRVGALVVTLDDALRTASAGRDRLSGEAAALDFAKLLVDARASATAPRQLVDAVAAPSLEPSIREQLVRQILLQRQVKAERHYDLSRPAFYRSSITGDPGSPSRVNFELAALLVSEPLNIKGYYATRFDVAWVQSRWRLTFFSEGAAADTREAVPTRQELRRWLRGPGWRELRR